MQHEKPRGLYIHNYRVTVQSNCKHRPTFVHTCIILQSGLHCCSNNLGTIRLTIYSIIYFPVFNAQIYFLTICNWAVVPGYKAYIREDQFLQEDSKITKLAPAYRRSVWLCLCSVFVLDFTLPIERLSTCGKMVLNHC